MEIRSLVLLMLAVSFGPCAPTIITRAFIPKCSEIRRSPCSTHRDCRCDSGGSQSAAVYACSLRGRCRTMTLFLIRSMVPCPDVFKNTCSSDADCPCSDVTLKCEDNECVRKNRSTARHTRRQALQRIRRLKKHKKRTQ